MADKLTLDRHDMKNRETAHLRIYVGGIPDNTTIDDLYNHFIEYGQINGVLVNRNFGFVQFETEESAQQAIAKGHGTQFLEKRLIVKTAQTTDKSRTENNTSFTETPAPAAPVDNADLYDNSGNYIGDQSYEEEEEYSKPWGGGMRGAARGRVMRMRGRGRGAPPGFRDRSPLGGRGGDWSERGPSYDRFPKSDFPRVIPVSEKNDCEIIVVSKSLTEYAEYIETRLKRLGIVVDLLYPMEDVPIGKVLGNIASRGCLYAILVMPLNQEHRSLTLTILHGLPQEHRNMPLEDALQLISRNYQEVQRGGSGGREAVYALLGQLADGRSLTVLQYDKILDYLKERREQQVKLELGEPTPPTSKQQVDLQQRILSILNDKKVPEPEPAPTQSKLLNDPTVRKALDSILQKFT